MIEVYSICWNEEYMLPHFLKHYDFADRIIIYDNGSTDNSIAIIKNSKAELKHYETNNQQNNDVMRDLKNNCWKGSKADWVIVCDMDEHVVGWEKLEEYKDTIPIIFQTKGYQMVCDSPPDDLSVIKRFALDVNMDKCLCFNPKLKEINYCHGCHTCNPIPDYIIIHNILYNYHYQFLGEEYVVKRWSDYFKRMSANDLQNKWGVQYMLGEQFARDTYKRIFNDATDL